MHAWDTRKTGNATETRTTLRDQLWFPSMVSTKNSLQMPPQPLAIEVESAHHDTFDHSPLILTLRYNEKEFSIYKMVKTV
jgi:hypothetical protein